MRTRLARSSIPAGLPTSEIATMAKSNNPAAAAVDRPVTLTETALKALLAEVRAEALAERGAACKADSAAQMEKLAIRAFTKAGFKDIQPRVNCLTFNKWLEKEMRPKEGEKAIR